jgi:hypothetical protein
VVPVAADQVILPVVLLVMEATAVLDAVVVVPVDQIQLLVYWLVPATVAQDLFT